MKASGAREPLEAKAGEAPAPPPRPRVLGRQNGSNCRHVAIGNVLRRPTVTASEMRDASAAFDLTFDPRALDVPGYAPAADFDAYSVSRQSLVGMAIERLSLGAGFPGLACATLPLRCAARPETVLGAGAGPVSSGLAAWLDPESPGALYFSRGHCMAAVQTAPGAWFLVPQNVATGPITASEAARRMTSGGHGVVLVWTPTFVASTVVPALLASLRPSARTVLTALRANVEACFQAGRSLGDAGAKGGVGGRGVLRDAPFWNNVMLLMHVVCRALPWVPPGAIEPRLAAACIDLWGICLSADADRVRPSPSDATKPDYDRYERVWGAVLRAVVV